jgi:uncharacterized membrane protein
MSTIKHVSIALIAAAVALAAAPANAGNCVRAGASATAITKEIAGELAKEALYQSNMESGRKGRGAVSVSCKYIGVVTDCTAKQVACK